MCERECVWHYYWWIPVRAFLFLLFFQLYNELLYKRVSETVTAETVAANSTRVSADSVW